MRGWTKTPCHGCGEPDHEIGKVCQDCQRLLDEAKATRERQAKEEEYGVYLHSDVPHWNPSYYDCPSGASRALMLARSTLQEAITSLALAVSEPATGKHYAGSTPALLERWSTNRYSGYNSMSQCIPLRMRVKVREAIAVLDTAVREVQRLAYVVGEQDGTNLLKQLAEGKLGQAEFNEKRRGHD